MHIAVGLDYRGRRTERQPVIYCAMEGHGGVGIRLIAALDHLKPNDPPPFALVLASSSFPEPEYVRQVAIASAELTAAHGGDCPLVVVDTFQAALGAGGNDCRPEDVTELIEAVKAELPGMTVLLLPHTGKDASRGARGWSGLLAALDVELDLSRDEDLRPSPLPSSATAATVRPPCASASAMWSWGATPTTSRSPPSSSSIWPIPARARAGDCPKVRAALEILWACIKDSSRSWPIGGTPLRCTMMGVWQKACTEGEALTRAKQKRDRAAKFRAAREELLDANLIVADGEDLEESRVYPAPKEKPNA